MVGRLIRRHMGVLGVGIGTAGQVGAAGETTTYQNALSNAFLVGKRTIGKDFKFFYGVPEI